MGNRERITVKCAGCGAILQQENPKLPGYLPPSTDMEAGVVCRRCFRMKHYNESSGITVDHHAFVQILNRIGHTDSLVVHIVDIYDFEGSLISGLARFVGDNPIVVAVNKIDLLPPRTNANKVMNWVQRQLKLAGLKVTDVIPISAKDNLGFEKLAASMEQYRKGKDVYVVGATNVGKSTMINNLIRHFSDLHAELTTSRYPGTTLDVVEIPLDDGGDLIDTPGIVYPHRMTERLPANELSKVVPDLAIKPKVYQLNAGQTLFLGGLVRFDFVAGERQSFSCFVSNALNIHRTRQENAERIYAQHRGGMLSPPDADTMNEFDAFDKWQRHTFTIRQNEQLDVGISGVGWIRSHTKTGAKVEVYVAKGIKVTLREALI